MVAARSLARSLTVRGRVVNMGVRGGGRSCRPIPTTLTTAWTRSVQTVPKVGTEAEMKAEVIDQIRARIAYQKEVLAANPHKSHDEEWEELWTWIKISFYVVVPGCIAMLLKDAVIEEHHHKPTGPLPEYMNIRSKEFPWSCDQCPLFDLKCWEKCKAERS